MSDAVLRPTFSVLRPPASTPFATLAECNRTCRSAQRRALELERVQTQVSRRIWKRPGSIALALAIVLAASFAAACHRQASRPIPEARTDRPRPLAGPRAAAQSEPNDYVFTGLDGEKGFASGSFLEREISLARGDLSIDRDAILVTPDLSDDAVRRYRWDPVHQSYVFVRDEEEGDGAPVATQT